MKIFFSNINVYDFFFRSWTENCRTLLMNLQPIVKKAFFLSRRTFSGRVNLFWKKTLTVRCFLSEFWPNIFRISGKNGISTEKYQYGCQNCSLCLQREFLGIFSGNDSNAKRFSQLERNFVKFFRKISADSWKVHHCVQMILLRKNLCFFGGIIVYKYFSVV